MLLIVMMETALISLRMTYIMIILYKKSLKDCSREMKKWDRTIKKRRKGPDYAGQFE